MPKVITILIAIVFSITLSSQENTEQKDIKNVINTFFEGLHKGDTTIIASTFHKNIKMETSFTDEKGEKKLVAVSREKLLKEIVNKKKENIFLEKLRSFDIKIDGNIAAVWIPYDFYLNGNFSHCGANSFQLFNDNGIWKIIYLVDMRRRDNCK